MEEKHGFKLFLVFAIFILFIVGGYVLMIKSGKPKTSVKNEKEIVKNTEIRKDPTQDYIIYSDEEVITEELDIAFVNVNLNFDDPNNVASTLNNIAKELKDTVKYDKENPELSYDGLTYVKYPKYIDYTYQNYLSLIANYYVFDDAGVVHYDSSKCYVFDKESGKLYSKSELLSIFKLTEDDVKSKVKKAVEDADLINGDVTLDATATVNFIDTSNLYVDKLGNLTISVLVKSSEKDYNEGITLS